MKAHFSLILMVAAMLFAFQHTVADTLCKAPDALMVSSLTTNSASITWGLTSVGDNPTAYSYTLKDANGLQLSHLDSLVAPGMSYAITGLAANTTYTVELAGNCQSSYSGLSDVASITFTTLCNPSPAPYTEDFNSLTALPACTYSSNASISQNGRTVRCLELSTQASSGAYIVFPELTLNSNNAEISFFIKVSSANEGNSTYQVGLCHDASDPISSFEPLFADTLTDIQWTEIRMNTASTSLPVTSTARLAIMFPSADGITYRIDDVSIHQIPTCVRPEQLSLTSVSATAASFTWTQSSATTNRIYACTATDTTAYTVGTSPATITGLTPNTDYSFSIRAICSAADSSELNPYPVSCHTRCLVADSATFSEGFEDVVTANTVPDCWTTGWLIKSSANTKTSPFSVSTVRSHSGARSMTLMDQQQGNRSYLASQQLPIAQSGQYTLSVWIYREDASLYPAEGLGFYVGSEPDDLTGATLLGFIPRDYATAPSEPQAGVWYNYEYVINATGNQYVIIEGVSQEGGATFFDDVEVKLTPSCLKVKDIAIDGIRTNEADLGWTAGRNEQQWIVNYTLTQGTTTVRTVTDTVNSPTIKISNLTEATQYGISGSVTSYCGGSDRATPVSFSFGFATACSPLTSLPYICGFEQSETTSAAHPMPFCWDKYNDAPGVYDYYPSVVQTSENARTGSGCLRFTTGTWPNYGDNLIAILPQVDTTIYPIRTLRLTYHITSDVESDGDMVYIGVMDAPDDYNSFVVVDSFYQTFNGYVRRVARFNNYTGTGSYMAIKLNRTYSRTVSTYIDDVTIEVNPSCADLYGEGATVSDIMDVSARVTVTETAATWSYAYGTAGTPATALTPVDATSATVTLTGLTSDTHYVVYVRRRCGTEYGAWSDGILFTTACGPISFPFTDDFEDYDVGTLAGCYQNEASGTLNTLDVLSGSGFNHTANGSKGLCSALYNASLATNQTFTIARLAHLEAGKHYRFSIYAKAGLNGTRLQDWTLSFVIGTNAVSMTDVSSHHVTATDFSRYDGYFSVTNTGDYYIGVHTAPILSYQVYYPYLDDIEITEVACIPPLTSQVNSVTPDSVNIGFGSTASQWEVAVSSSPIDINGIVTGNIYHDTVSVNNFSVGGLTPNTLYYYTIRSLCTSEASAWMMPETFRTQCAAATLPYTVDFEDASSAYCWTQVGVTGTVSHYTMGYYSRDNSSLKVDATSVAAPEINVTSLSQDMVSGWAYSPSRGATLVVMLSTDITDASSISDAVATITLDSAYTWYEFTVPFDTFLNDPDNSEFVNARYIIISSGQSTIYLDDIIIDRIQTCVKPSAGSIGNVTANSATVDWTENGTATQWLVTAVPDTGATITQTATVHPYTLTGLHSATNYTIYVTALCQPSDTSYRVKVGTITTDCDYVHAPYSENFEGMTGYALATCWDNSSSTTATVSTSPEDVWGVYVLSNNNSLRLNNRSVLPGTAVVTSPEIILDPAKRYRLGYDYCHQATCGDLTVNIRRHGESQSTVLATHSSSGSIEGTSPLRFLQNELRLNSYAGDTVQVEFFANANSGFGAIWIDNVLIREVTAAEDSCRDIVNLQINNALTTDTSVTASCVNPNAGSTLRWAVSTSSSVNDTIASGTSATETFTITGLPASSSFYLLVRSDCSATDHSAWVSVPFSTLCGAVSIYPFTQDFESTTFPPRCWSNISLTTGSGWQGAIPGSWTRMASSYASYGNGSGWATLSGSAGASALLVTPALRFEPGREYHVSFVFYRSRNSIFGTNITDALNVYVGNSPSKSGAALLASYIVGDDNVNSGLYTYDLDIPANISGDSYVMFEGIFNNYGAVRIDDITIDRYPLCRDLASAPTVVSTTATTITVSETKRLNHTLVEYGIAPYSASATPADITLIIPSDSAANAIFTSLTNGTGYSIFARAICACGDTTAWTAPVHATTKADNCFTPEGVHVVGQVGDTSVTIAWNVVPAVSSYVCVFKAGNVSDTVTVTTNQVTYTGLQASTTYLFSVTGNCQSGPTGTASIRFKTISHPAVIPYFTGFENGFDNANWDRVNSSRPNNFTFGRDTAGLRSGEQGLYVSDDDSLYHQTLPTNGTQMTLNDIYDVAYVSRVLWFNAAGNYELSYDWRCDAVVTSTSNAYTAFGRAFLVPINTSLPADDDDYKLKIPTGGTQLGDDLTGNQSWERSATIVNVTSPCYKRLVFMWYSDNHFNGASASEVSAFPLAIDNVSVIEARCLPVNSFSIVSTCDTAATVAVAKADPSGLEYALITVNSSDSITTYTTLASTSLADTIRLSGLTPLSTYYLFVRQRCDSAETSSWRSVKVQTTSVPATIPYVCGFESVAETSNWRYAQTNTNQFVISNAIASVGNNSLYVSNDGSSYYYDLSSESFAYAYRTLSLQAGLYEYGYDWKAYGEHNHDFGRAFLLPTNAPITAGGYIAGFDKQTLPAGAVALDGGGQLNLSSDYVSVSDTFTLSGDGFYNLVFFWHNDGGSGRQSPLSIDNISIVRSSCMFPAATIDSIGENAAVASITNRSDSSALVYAVSPDQFIEHAIIIDTLPYNPAAETILLTGLSGATDYNLILRSICSPTDESILHRIPFRTVCFSDTILIPGDTFTDTICHNTAYTLHGFNVPASQVADGWNTLTRTIVAPGSCTSDTLVTAYVFVRSDISTTQYDTICGGDSYTRGRWNITNPSSRRYFSTFRNAAACGCDSTVELYLTVIPTMHTEYDTICLGGSLHYGDTTLTTAGTYRRITLNSRGCNDTTMLHLFVADTSSLTNAIICQGQVYTFEGQAYTAAGTYRVLTTGIHGCPMAKTLNLSVISTDTTLSVSFCRGGSVQVLDTVISRPGNYTVVRVNSQGCDVTYHISATENPIVPEEVYDIACQGHPYSGYGINRLTVTSDTVVTINTKTLDGLCDSVSHVNLSYVPTAYSDTFASIYTGESFTWYNRTYTETGDYTETLSSVVTGCDSVVTLHLHVKGVGVDDVTTINIQVVPNPVAAGTIAYLYGDFDLTDIQTLEILNSFGQVVSTFTPATYPIELPAISTSGVYYVRLTFSTNQSTLQKLIVR